MLILQFASITLLTQTTRLPQPGRVMYAGSAAVLVSELVKLPFCLALVARDEGGLGGLVREVREKVPSMDEIGSQSYLRKSASIQPITTNSQAL